MYTNTLSSSQVLELQDIYDDIVNISWYMAKIPPVVGALGAGLTGLCSRVEDLQGPPVDREVAAWPGRARIACVAAPMSHSQSTRSRWSMSDEDRPRDATSQPKT